MRKGDRVYVRFSDICADLHTDEKIETVEGEFMGWIVRQSRKEIEFAYCRYRGKCNLRDGIALPKACIISMEKI